MNKGLGFVLRILSLVLLALIAMSRDLGIPIWGSVLLLLGSGGLFLLSTKGLK